MTVKERLKQFIEYKRISVRSFERTCGLSYGYVSNMRVSIQPDKIANIAHCFPELNTGWLLTGEGEMIRDSENPVSIVQEPEIGYKSKPHYLYDEPKTVPHIIDECADCGKPNGFGIAIMEDRCPRYAIPGLSGHDFTIIARGRSMINRSFPEKSIRPGDIVGCKKWNSRSHLRWGEVYALSTPDGITIKQIQPSEKEGCIKCIPFNTEEQFQPFDLPLEEIYDWAIVVGVVSVMLWA